MTFEEWMKAQDPDIIRDAFSAAAGWKAAQAAERERIKQIVDEVAWQGNHDKWFDCADAIVERIEDVKQ